MAMFGKRKPAPRPVFDEPLPAIDAPAPAVSEEIPQFDAPVLPQRKGGIFGSGITGKQVLRTAGDILQFGPFAPLARERINNYREDRRLNNVYKMALAQQAMEPDEQWEPVPGDDGRPYALRSRRTGDMKAYPGAKEPTSWQERVIARLMDPATPQPEKDILRPMLTGFQYTPQGIQAVVETAQRTQPFKGGSGASGGLRVGQVVDGYTYIGGDPNDQSSWRQ